MVFAPRTATPIKHLVVIFQENVSFDHYFRTYPNAANTDGSPFHTRPGTPKVNGLTPALLTNNPNAAEPQRLTHSEALTGLADRERIEHLGRHLAVQRGRDHAGQLP